MQTRHLIGPIFAIACLVLSSASHAQTKLPTAPKPPSAKAPDVRSNPLAYHVPEAWRERVRVFIDPGPSGLEGGFVLTDMSLGHDILATYKGPKSKLLVRVIPARVAIASDYWLGKRVALRVESDVAQNGPALAHLKRLLTDRESGWGWLRRDPSLEEREEAALEARAEVATARRLLAIGHVDKAISMIHVALQKAPTDVLAHLRAARALYRAQRPSLAKLKAEAVLATAIKGLEAKGLDIALTTRTKVHVARAMALAEDIAGGQKLGLELTKEALACEATPLAADLFLVNAVSEAKAVTNALTARDAGCDKAQALQVDLNSQVISPQKASALAETLITARTGLAITRSAWARSALALGELETATTQAAVAVEQGTAIDDTLLVLAAVLNAGGTKSAPMAKWANMLERDPTPPNRGLGAAMFFARGDYDRAVEHLTALESELPKALRLKAMRAYTLSKAGKLPEAKAALKSAWRSDQAELWAVAAEAEIAEAEKRTKDATLAWESYLMRLTPGHGPISRAIAVAKLEALGTSVSHRLSKGKHPKPGTTEPKSPSTQTPSKPDQPQGESLWLSLIGLCIAFSLLWWWRRSR